MQKLPLVLFLALFACAPSSVEAPPVVAPAASPRTAAREVPITKVAGYVVRTESGEIVVDVPREREPTRHIHPVGVQLDAPRGPSRRLPDGSVDGSELLGALATTARRTEMRASEEIVVLEGRIHPRRDAREIDLDDAIITSKVTKRDWTRAFAEYETRLARDLYFLLASADNAHVADAIERAEEPILDLVRPADASLFEVVRFWNEKRRHLRSVPDQRAGDAFVRWADATLTEYNLEGELLGRPQPTNTERDTYRELFDFAANRTLEQAVLAEEEHDTAACCDAASQASRLLDVYDPKSAPAALARELVAKSC